MTLFALQALKFAPILYAITASWAFSNQQVFRNSVVLNDTKNLYPYSGHHVSQFLTQLTPASVWPLVIPFTLINLILSKIGCNALSKCHPKSKLVKCLLPMPVEETVASNQRVNLHDHLIKDNDATESGGSTGSEKKKKRRMDYDDLDDFVPAIDPDQTEYFSRLKYSDHYTW